MSRRVVYVDHVVDLLHQLASRKFTVMDTSFRRYLDALADVEEGLKDLHQMDVAKTRTGYWQQEPDSASKFRCSVCGAVVWYQNRIRQRNSQPPECKYLFCPCCRTPMEVKRHETD